MSTYLASARDAATVIQSLDDAMNAHDLDAVMSLFSDYAVVKHTPAPDGVGIYVGKEQIRRWFQPQMAGFHVVSRDRRTSSDTVSWSALTTHDLLKQMGQGQPVEAELQAAVREGKITFFAVANPSLVAAGTGGNKATVRRFIEEVFNKGNLDAVDGLVASDYVNHGAGLQEQRGPEGMRAFVAIYRTAFPDYSCTIDDQIAEGEKVVSRWTVRGTHRGALMGIPPTGKQITLSGIVVDRIANGKLLESWLQADVLGMLQQLGAIPTSEQAAA